MPRGVKGSGPAAAKPQEPISTVTPTAQFLELLKLVYRHDKDPQYLVNRAREFEALMLQRAS